MIFRYAKAIVGLTWTENPFDLDASGLRDQTSKKLVREHNGLHVHVLNNAKYFSVG